MVTRSQADELFNEIAPALNGMGKNNPRKGEIQTLYGDVLDWIKDCHSEFVNKDYDDDFLAHYIIGSYVIKNRLL